MKEILNSIIVFFGNNYILFFLVILLVGIIILLCNLTKPLKKEELDVEEESIPDTTLTSENSTIATEIVVKKKGLTAIQSARLWWKSINLSEKKVCMYDAQLEQVRLSQLTGAQILTIYTVYLERINNPSK